MAILKFVKFVQIRQTSGFPRPRKYSITHFLGVLGQGRRRLQLVVQAIIYRHNRFNSSYEEIAVINCQSDVLNLDLNPGTNSPSPASMMLGLSVASSGSKRHAPATLTTALKRRKVEEQLREDVLTE